MFYTIADDLIFYQLLSFIKKYTNYELKLREYFHNKTKGVYPEFIVVINQFIFFFVKKKDYLNSNMHINSMRRQITKRKILIIRIEKILINLLFSFFPDLNIDDIKIEFDDQSGNREISVYFLFYEERGRAIGRNGDYIRAVNHIFENQVVFENNNIPLKVKCKFKK
ncbi:MAG: hypothetical protein CEE43_06190 [Promethearchaeota archaeon Loki_b32]|nr:MAG: hypothetical protein CEE43_06190 [Candidatus Lokiarchaeota archaeon Loki_b32]